MPTLNTYNHDIVGIYSRVNRFLTELYKSVSSGGSQMNAFDYNRLSAYMANIKGYVDWVVGQPHLDCPETHPRLYVLDEMPVIEPVENEEVNDVIRILTLARDELIMSQSTRDPSNIKSFDLARFTAVIEKVEAFMTQYIQPLTPLDLPESSPHEPMSGPGQTGI